MYADVVVVIAILAQTTSESSTPYFGLVVGNLIVGGVVGFFIGNWKNRPVLGTILGALLGCLGWIITAVLSKKHRY